MKKKPKYLIGKIKEFSSIDSYDFYTYVNSAFEKDFDRCFFDDIQSFYSQPFQPEMITEYFKGWEFDGYCDPTFRDMVYKNNKECTYTYSEPNVLCRGSLKYLFPKIKTLSQFITNCIQVDIKLEWK